MLSVTVAHLPPNTARASTGARDEEMRAEVIWFDTGGVPCAPPTPLRNLGSGSSWVSSPSTSAALMIAIVLLIGLELMHLASLYGPSHVARPQSQSSTQ
jgi:hypothetical protein